MNAMPSDEVLMGLHQQLILGERCVTGAALATPRPVPDQELPALAIAWGTQHHAEARCPDVAAAVTAYLGGGDPASIELLAVVACRAHPDAVGMFLRVAARTIERLSGYAADGRGRSNPHAERWLETCRRETGASQVDDWRKRLVRHRWAARGEHRVTLAAAIRRRLTAKELEQIARRAPPV